MSIIEWSEDMSVGVARLDEHHRRLIDLTNQLGSAIADGDPEHTTGAVLGELVRYVYYHFGEEERLMEQAAYGGLDAHRCHHRAMAEHVRGLETRSRAFSSWHACFCREPSPARTTGPR